jgi:hypothetical protein
MKMLPRRTRGKGRKIKEKPIPIFTSERHFQDTVIEMALAIGFLVGFTFSSKNSRAGEPDLRLVHKHTGRVIFAELKLRESANLTAGRWGGHQGETWLDGQDEWAEALAAGPVEYFLLKPSDWASGRIEQILQKS